MEKKILFLDLDGTLLNDRKEITPGNRRALEQLQRDGHRVVITTGRPLKSAMEQARRLEMDRPGCFLIAFNGAAIYDWERQAQVFVQGLELPAVLQVFAYANSKNLHIQTYDAREVLVERRCDDATVRRYCGLVEMDFRVVEDIRGALRELPAKALVIDYDDQAGLLQTEQWLRQKMAHQVDCFFSCDQYLEIVPKGINKGEAVRRLCGIVNIPIEATVAVGDAANDLSMLRAAGIGVSMANATDEVKAAADAVTQCDNNHDGVAEVIAKYFSR